MKISHKYLLVPGALIAFLAAFPVQTFCQAFVLGKNPSFTALNLRNKKAHGRIMPCGQETIKNEQYQITKDDSPCEEQHS